MKAATPFLMSQYHSNVTPTTTTLVVHGNRTSGALFHFHRSHHRSRMDTNAGSSQADLLAPFLSSTLGKDGLEDGSAATTVTENAVSLLHADETVFEDVSSSDLGPIHPHEHHPIEGGMTALTLAMIIFYNSSGGPFGIEPSLKAAGNLYSIIGFALMPFIWAVPEVYMTSRLSALYPCASGGVLWLEKAFGLKWGLMVGYLGWLGGVVLAASYPALLYEYIMIQFFGHVLDVNPLVRYGVRMGLTLLLSYVNYRGLSFVGKTSTFIFMFSMLPFMIMAVIGIPKIDPKKWLETPLLNNVEEFDDDSLTTNGWFPLAYVAGIAFRPFINNLYWNFNGFDQAGHYSSSVPKKTFQRGIAGSLLLVSSTYLIPILVATGATDISQDEWKAGWLAVAGTEIGGKWLGNWLVVSAAISLAAAFFAELSADSMQLMGMADRAQIPGIFSYRSSSGTPTISILLCLVLMSSVLPFEFGMIIELANFGYCIAVSLEFTAFAELVIRRGDESKLRKVMYSFLMIPPMVLNVLIVLLASYSTYIYAAVVILVGMVLINGSSIYATIRRFARSKPVKQNSIAVGSSKAEVVVLI